MRKLKKMNGITLVALVIAIIILLILAGIVINLSFGTNGILTRVRRSREKLPRSN